MKNNGTTIYNESHSRLTSELERLSELRRQGLLTDDEFAQAKSRLLTQPETTSALALLTWQAELERLDRVWAQEQERYKISGRYGHRILPDSNPVGILFGAILGIGFVIFWIFGSAQAGAPPFFSLFGVIMLVDIIGKIATDSMKHASYEEAKAHYEKQRTEHLQQRPT